VNFQLNLMLNTNDSVREHTPPWGVQASLPPRHLGIQSTGIPQGLYPVCLFIKQTKAIKSLRHLGLPNASYPGLDY